MTANEILTLVLSGGSLIVAGLSARYAFTSARAAEKQLAFVERKIGMVTDPAKMTEILPVWYIERMARDQWGFGLLLASGDILAIATINGVSDDRQWIEVQLLTQGSGPNTVGGVPILYAPEPKRPTASVRVDQIQTAFELWSS